MSISGRHLGIVAAWLLAMTVLASRRHLLMPYAVSILLPPSLEPFGAGGVALVVILALGGLWLGLATAATTAGSGCGWAQWTLLIASTPSLLWAARAAGLPMIPPTFIEIMWMGGWTGLSFGQLIQAVSQQAVSQQASGRKTSAMFARAIDRLATGIVVGLTLGCAGWWIYQAWYDHHSFMLGFNDFGHFLQRVANTAEGRGMLLETPVLPAFWDHFNPGLLLLVPLWWIWPEVYQAFAWQALALAGSGYLVYRISLTMGNNRTVSLLWSLAWLAQPVVGQMNLAYSYGWHPITFAIPLLLASIWALLNKRHWLAGICCLLALSMEEGVFVIVSLAALCFAAWQLTSRWRSNRTDTARQPGQLIDALPAATWLSIGVTLAVGFVLVYKLSGLAEFQTGRFVALGSNLSEVMLSPVLRPAAFWGSLFALDRWFFLLLLWMPCGLAALVRGWPYLLPTMLPLGVLMVWDHAPAHCIAFQYPSTLLPFFWMATLSGARELSTTGQASELRSAGVAAITGLVLSVFIGQQPYSSPTLLDVDGRTWGPDSVYRRRPGEEDSDWLYARLREVREQPQKCLATGRIAAHLVGMPDIETVGQYLERREKLSQLPDRLGHPLKHYDVIVLDRQEEFQQSRQQSEAVETEALLEGFMKVAENYDMVILKPVASAASE